MPTPAVSHAQLAGMPTVAGVEHSLVEVAPGVALHVAQAGSGEPLVLLHGWPQHWFLWRALIPELAQRYRVICPDLRGQGWSDVPAGDYAKERLAADVLGLLDALDIERTRLIGHDWGAWTGFLACLRAPERFERFLALGAPHPFQRTDPQRLLNMWRLWYQAVIAAPGLGEAALRHGGFAQRIMRGAVGPDYKWEETVVAAFASRLHQAPRARASVALYRTFLLHELPALATGRYEGQRLEVPTLLMAGEHDPAVRPQTLAGGAAHARELHVEVVPRCGHFIVDEMPDLVMARIRDWF